LKEFKGVISISILGYVLLGVLLVSIILPLIDALAGLILTIIEVAKGYFSVKVAEYNTRLKKIAYNDDEEPEPSVKHLIGFARENEEDEENDTDI
jgi:hypothetical protein